MIHNKTFFTAFGLHFLLAVLFFPACKDKTDTNEYAFGKNRFTISVDGDDREFYVHVPASYDHETATPIVIMLHGTSGDGEKFYNISGWKELGEKENILTVYPSSWRHCIIEDSGISNTTKWNIYPGSFEYCAGEQPRDDVKFLREMIGFLKETFKVDQSRIYLAGFSNGGQMAFRCGVEMSDLLAAVIESAGGPQGDSTYAAKKQIPVAFQVGDKDDRYFQQQVPLSAFEQGLNTIPYFKNLINTHQKTFGFAENYTMSGDTTTAMVATFPSTTSNSPRELKVMMIYNAGHIYPNGINHWMKSAEIHWDWFKKFTN